MRQRAPGPLSQSGGAPRLKVESYEDAVDELGPRHCPVRGSLVKPRGIREVQL